ncbi:hypothetical protein MJ863_04240 [Alcaligenes ammonioxydans]|uniref:hypothetical protein n=1 Tax=Alcaligenes ammonioxydans TaxID=2582914 RepID=UPI001F0564AA|nr:hypothetical protein [Alcaligenes ammonioxydans]MCH1878796.1 hypothetical protein [Alcaligenes ammonioxydans]
MSKYPVLRVILAFSLVPMWGGLCMGLAILFTMPASDTVGILLNVWLQFVMLLLSLAVALFFEVVPAAILGALYAWIKLKRGALSYLLVFICGGSTAYAWTVYVFGLGGNDLSARFQHAYPLILQNIQSKAFVLGAIFSLITAMVVLPPSRGEQSFRS